MNAFVVRTTHRKHAIVDELRSFLNVICAGQLIAYMLSFLFFLSSAFAIVSTPTIGRQTDERKWQNQGYCYTSRQIYMNFVACFLAFFHSLLLLCSFALMGLDGKENKIKLTNMLFHEFILNCANAYKRVTTSQNARPEYIQNTAILLTNLQNIQSNLRWLSTQQLNAQIMFEIKSSDERFEVKSTDEAIEGYRHTGDISFYEQCPQRYSVKHNTANIPKCPRKMRLATTPIVNF
uniref:Uncharacterized protein n=1 Tax=Glossina brevipalpis TaxID=37001 RepID=A0A1A9WMS7_9MUSC